MSKLSLVLVVALVTMGAYQIFTGQYLYAGVSFLFAYVNYKNA